MKQTEKLLKFGLFGLFLFYSIAIDSQNKNTQQTEESIKTLHSIEQFQSSEMEINGRTLQSFFTMKNLESSIDNEEYLTKLNNQSFYIPPAIDIAKKKEIEAYLESIKTKKISQTFKKYVNERSKTDKAYLSLCLYFEKQTYKTDKKFKKLNQFLNKYIEQSKKREKTFDEFLKSLIPLQSTLGRFLPEKNIEDKMGLNLKKISDLTKKVSESKTNDPILRKEIEETKYQFSIDKVLTPQKEEALRKSVRGIVLFPEFYKKADQCLDSLLQILDSQTNGVIDVSVKTEYLKTLRKHIREMADNYQIIIHQRF